MLMDFILEFSFNEVLFTQKGPFYKMCNIYSVIGARTWCA